MIRPSLTSSELFLPFCVQSISLQKLAQLMQTDESSIRTHMMTLKSQTMQKEWAGEGDATEGTWVNSGDVDFYVDVDPTTGNEMVIVTETVVTKRQGDFLARHILKLEEIQRDLTLAQPVQTTNPAAAAYA
jgi:hypothetical protein